MLRAIVAVALVLLLVVLAAAAGGAQPPPGVREPTRIINLGHVEVWGVPPDVIATPVPRKSPTPSPAPPSSPTRRATVVIQEPLPPGYPPSVSLAEARALVAFPLLVPTWLPWPQDEPTDVRVFQRPGRPPSGPS